MQPFPVPTMQPSRLIDILFRQDTNNIWLQWFRYCFVAVGAFAVDYGRYFLASYVIGIPYLIAAVIGFVLGTLTNYAISKFLVFRGEPKSRTGEIAMVFLIGGIGLIFLELGIWFFTEIVGVHYLVSKLIMTVIVFAWNFLARKFFMYSKRFNILKSNQ